MAVRFEPYFAFGRKMVAGGVVDHEEDLATAPRYQVLEKLEERVPIEYTGKLPAKSGFVLKRNGAEYMGCFPHPEGVHTGLNPNFRPRLMKCSVKPEARLILEHHDTAASLGFFLSLGKVSLSQVACACASARANRFLGLWTEKPSW